MSADHEPGHDTGHERGHDTADVPPPAAPEPLPAGHSVHVAHAVHPEQRFEERARWVAVTPSNARRIVATALGALVLLWVAVTVFQSTSSFLFLLLLAWLLSIAMEPIVLWLSHRGVKRGLATGLTMLAMVLVFVGLAELFGSVFASQLSQLGTRLPEAVAAALDWVNATFHTTFDLSQLQQALSLTPDKLGELAGKYGGGILGVFGSVGNPTREIVLSSMLLGAVLLMARMRREKFFLLERQAL